MNEAVSGWVRTSNDKCCGGDHLGEARLYGDAAHRSSIEVRLRVVGDVDEPGHATVVHGWAAAGDRGSVEEMPGRQLRQRCRRRRQVKRVSLVYSKDFQLQLLLIRGNVEMNR